MVDCVRAIKYYLFTITFHLLRLNANPLPLPYHRPVVQESRLSNGNVVMMPPSSPRKTAGNKYVSEKAKQQPYKNVCKPDVTCEYRYYI